jgi:hypothetical protein
VLLDSSAVLKDIAYRRTGFGFGKRERERVRWTKKREGKKGNKLRSAERRPKKIHRLGRQDWIINKTFPKCFLYAADGGDLNSQAA